MTRLMIPIFGLMAMSNATSQAQFTPYPYAPQGGYGNINGNQAPNFQNPYFQNMYNRNTQPLSPYLNLLRGQGNPAIDYYYGVRPGIQGAPLSNSSAGNNFLPGSQMRVGYLPQAGAMTPAPLPVPDAGQEVILTPSGHIVTYGNYYGISRTGIPGIGSGSRSNFFAPPRTGTVQPTKSTKK